MSESSEAYKDGVAVGMARQFNNLRDANLLKGEAAPSTDVQQLKAEIASHVKRAFELLDGGDIIAARNTLKVVMAQLSAV